MLNVLKSLTRVIPTRGPVCAGSAANIQRQYCDYGESEEVMEQRAPPRNVQVLSGERSLNRMTIIGRIGRDPEIRGREERPVTILSVATSLTIRSNDGEYKQYTDWHRVAVFREKLQQYAVNALSRGDRVFVSGPMRYSRYINQATNESTKIASIVAEDIILLSHANRKQQADEDEDVEEAL